LFYALHPFFNPVKRLILIWETPIKKYLNGF
jgi:hypothetical protein